MHNDVAEAITSLVRAASRLNSPDSEATEIADEVNPLLAALDEVAWAAAEEELLAAGINRSTVSALAHLHRRQIGLNPHHTGYDRRLQAVPAGHPIDTIILENAAIGRVTDELSEMIDSIAAVAIPPAEFLDRLRRSAQALSEVKNHHARVQGVLLPRLERRGLQGLTRTLWAYYGGVRSRLTALHALLAGAPSDPSELRAALSATVPALLKSLYAGIEREDRVLVPLLLRLLTEEEWADIWRDSQSCGWCLVQPGTEYSPSDASGQPEEAGAEWVDRVRFAAGELSVSQLRGVFAALPFDLTFVDENDAVRFFTEGPDRLFQRTRSVIGRKVQNCHPPSSLRQVNRILGDFRRGRRDVAEFWFDRRGQFVHVRYFAVRDSTGAYRGTLEVAQDLTRLRALHGEQRILMDRSAESDIDVSAESVRA